MGSEYYKKKFQDVKPDAPLELTKKEKWLNWWDYHWGHVLIAVGVAVVLSIFVGSFIFRVRPDYKVAVVGSYGMFIDAEYLQEELAALGEDANGDGKVVVQVRTFAVDEGSPDYEQDMVGLIGDIGVCNSQIFILEDAQTFMQTHGIITEDALYAWSDCPALAHIELGGDFSVALRTYPYEEAVEKNAHAEVLWQAMTAGAE